MFRRSTLALALLACCSFLAMPAAMADTLDDVQKAGVLRVAITLDYPPFGSVDASMSPQGYDVEFANLMAAALGVKAELVRVTAQTKIPTMATRKADLLLNIGRNEERAKVVDFTQPYAPYYIGVFGPVEQTAASVADLAGKKVAVTRGTLEDQLLTKMAPTDANIQRYEDHSNTISSFLSGQSDLMSVGNIVAAAIMDKNPPRKPRAEVPADELAGMRGSEQGRAEAARSHQRGHRRYQGQRQVGQHGHAMAQAAIACQSLIGRA